MTTQAFPFAAVVTANDAAPTDGALLVELVRLATDAGAAPVIVAVPPGVEVPGATHVVRTRPSGSPIAAIRLGMAQLTNTRARAALLIPYGTERKSLVALLALIDAGKRSPANIVAFEGAPLGRSPLLVPRDMWLELVTLGESGMDAIAARRDVLRVRV